MHATLATPTFSTHEETIVNAVEAVSMYVERMGGNTEGWRRNLAHGGFVILMFGDGHSDGGPDEPQWSVGEYDADGDDLDLKEGMTFAEAMDAVRGCIGAAS